MRITPQCRVVVTSQPIYDYPVIVSQPPFIVTVHRYKPHTAVPNKRNPCYCRYPLTIDDTYTTEDMKQWS